MKTAVIIGAGPGLGNHIALKFASEGYQVALVSRKKEKLDEYVEEIKKAGYKALAVAGDASDEHQVKKIFEQVKKELGSVDALIYNAADLNQKPVLELSGKELTDHFKVDVAGAQNCVLEVLPSMIDKKEGTILFTGGLFGVFPNANYNYACISIDKAALRALAQMLHDALKDKGIFAGIVNVMGVIGGNEGMSPANIAEAFWQLAQKKENFEVNYPQ